jgi:hypothetical protein
MKSYLNFFTEAEDNSSAMPQPNQRVHDDVMTVFGRHNPPHLGHQLTMDKANTEANNIGADQRFYSSRSQDAKKNPLPYELKINHLKKMFPDHADKWDTDESMKTVLDTAKKAHKDGYKNFHFMGGSDRREDMENLLRKYNGDLYDFENIYSHSAGDREDVDPEDFIGNLSASKQRGFAQSDDFDSFKEGLAIGPSYTEKDAKDLFSQLQMFMQKNEDYDVRELYATDKIFLEGDIVESTLSCLRGTIHRRGANHLICVTEDGIMFKSFLSDVYPV